MELGLARLSRDRSCQEWQCALQILPLIVNHAEKMLRQRVLRLSLEHVAVELLRSIRITSLV